MRNLFGLPTALYKRPGESEESLLNQLILRFSSGFHEINFLPQNEVKAHHQVYVFCIKRKTN